MSAFVFTGYAFSIRNHYRSQMTCPGGRAPRGAPVLVADVLDTLVVDPFFAGMSSYFGFDAFDDFLEAKTPGLWVEFEKGHIGEDELARNFFKDQRYVDIPRFKRYLKSSYSLIPGISPILMALRDAQIEVHLCTNYPVWADLIEESLHLKDRFGVHWTFVSGREGVRKPDKMAFLRTAEIAGVDPSACVLLDDRQQNCKGALEAGFLQAIQFRDAEQATQDVRLAYARYDIAI